MIVLNGVRRARFVQTLPPSTTLSDKNVTPSPPSRCATCVFALVLYPRRRPG